MRTTKALLVAVGLIAPVAYLALGRERCLTWGATEDEVGRPMPGDDLLRDPDIISTRAISVDAPPAAIWPWLMQMGPGRGGLYTYDWIENLFGLNMHSAHEILPQFQDLKVGDVQQLGSKGPRLKVEVLDLEQALVVRSEDGNWVWAFVLFPEGKVTRLVSRNPNCHTGRVPACSSLQHVGHGTRQPRHGAQDVAGHPESRRVVRSGPWTCCVRAHLMPGHSEIE